MSKKMKTFEKRKEDHIRWALDQKTQNLTDSHFNRVRLKHEALPEINLSDVSLDVKLLKENFKSPHFVSSMTAGHKNSSSINARLALAAAHNGWLMAVGSQRRELDDMGASQEWKKIKSEYRDIKNTKFISNIGLEEVIVSPVDKILKLIESIEAIGLYIHINPLQEAFQKTDQAQFKGGLKAIEKICKKSPVPVLIKEVGFGLNQFTAQRLFDVGVDVVDVAGKGGTHWGVLEGLRDNSKQGLLNRGSLAFIDWGYSTVESLINCKSLVVKHNIWASGGIRSGVDSLKCLALGAKAVGVAQPLMKAAIESELVVSDVMQRFDYELKVAMFGTGSVNLKTLEKKKVWYETGIS